MNVKSILNRIVCFSLIISFIFIQPIAAFDNINSDNIVIERSLNLARYEELLELLNTISLAISSLDESATDYESSYQKLLSQYNAAISELDSMEAVLDRTQLEKFAIQNNSSVNSLPGNLGDLEDYYYNWFFFTGYEETIHIGNEVYYAYVIAITAKPGVGILQNQTATQIINHNDISGGVGPYYMSTLLNHSLSLSYDYAYSIWGNGGFMQSTIYSWLASGIFAFLIDQINSGTVYIANYNDTVYNHLITTSTTLYYAYVWDVSSQMWVHCLSSNSIYTQEDHDLKYQKYISPTGLQFVTETENVKTYNNIIPYPTSNLATTAVSLYTSNGNSAPSFIVAYDAERIYLRKDGNLINTIYPVTCPNPGNLWQLGNLIN